MNPIFVNKSPKSRFMEAKSLVDYHRKVTEPYDFQHILDHALLEYVAKLARQPAAEAGASHFKMVGAQEFMAELKALSFVESPRKIPDIDNLNHNA